MLTNNDMLERARVGLKAWFCRRAHCSHHRMVAHQFDSSWQFMSFYWTCSKCGRQWETAHPAYRAFQKHLCEIMTPTIQKLLWEKDPIYAQGRVMELLESEPKTGGGQ